MVNLFLFVFSINSLMALEGTFEVNGEFDIMQERQVEVIFHSKKDQLADLKAKNFQCGKRGRFYKCVRFVPEPSLPKDLTVLPKRKRFEFGPIVNKEIIAEGDDVLQYETGQEVIVDGQTYLGTRYTETKELKKIKIGLEEGLKPIYVIVTDEGVAEVQRVTKSQSRFSWREFLLLFHYSETES